MKTIVISLLLACSVCVAGHAQNRSIRFEQKGWKEALKQAKKQKKLVFLDCYTSWCGPCKLLAKEVFTDDAVADYYNEHFVCLKIDMEKGDPELVKSLPVNAYPTLLYLDEEGKVQHKYVGYCGPEALIGQGKLAYDGEHNYVALRKRYKAGDREAAFVRNYLEVLERVSERQELGKATLEYLETLEDEDFFTKETWTFLEKGLDNPLSRPFQKLLDGKNKFYELVGREVVDQKISVVLAVAVSAVTGYSPFGEARPFREAEYERLLAFLQKVPLDCASRMLAQLYFGKQVYEKDYNGMLDNMRTILKYNIFGEEGALSFLLVNVDALKGIQEPQNARKAIGLLDELFPLLQHPLQESLVLERKAAFMEITGEMAEAQKVKAAAAQAEAKGQKMVEEQMAKE